MSAATAVHYIAYLVRLWREGPDIWRGMLEDPHTGERFYFKDANDLLAFLREQITQENEASHNS